MNKHDGVFDADQLLGIAKKCSRWSGIDSLPAAIRDTMRKLDALSERHAQTGSGKAQPRFRAAIESACVSLHSEFSRAQIAFDCPACPLRPKL